MTNEVIETLEESGSWRTREVTYWAGRWEKLRCQIPQFETVPFQVASDTPANPYMKSVIRLPRTKIEQSVPVGIVSNTYTLAQHSDVARKCLQGIQESGIETENLRCELGLTELGEWMNLRIYFPDEYSATPKDKQKLALRLECFNSVDGSSRLVILLGWFRFVCSNGMVIGETKTEFRDIHNKNMDLERIPKIICQGLKMVQADLERLKLWEETPVGIEKLKPWANTDVSKQWGKKAACRVYHICEFGHDVKITDPFAPGDATDKPTKALEKVPGALEQVTNLYDVSQALSWVATQRKNPEERVDWQSAIPDLIKALSAA